MATVPVLWLVLAALMANAAGRFSPHDPDYYYLLSSLDLAEWRSIGMYHHPGTPAEMLGALVIRLAHFSALGATGIQTAVLSDPERYLALINYASALLIAFGLLAVGLTALKTTGRVWLSAWLQLSVFLAPVVVTESGSRFKAEPLMLLASLLFIAVSIAFIRSNEADSRRFALWFAAVCGFGLATKITFVSVAIAPLVMLTGRRRMWFIVGTVVATIAWTLPIADHYVGLATLMYNIASHTGAYGQGEPGVIDISSYREGASALFVRNPVFDTVVVGGIVAMLAVALSNRGKWRQYASDREWRVLGALILAQVFGFILAAKDGAFPTNRYLLASSCLLGMTLWLTIAALRKAGWSRRSEWATTAVLVLAVTISAADTPGVISRHMAGLRATQRQNHANQMRLSVLDGWQFVDYARVYDYANAGPVLGLFHASFYSLGQVDALARTYPGVFLCAAECTVEDWALRRYWGFHHTRQFSAEEIRAASGGRVVLILGTPPQLHIVD